MDHSDARRHELDVIKQMSQAQVDNQKILADALVQQSRLVEVQKDLDAAKMEVIRQAARADSITFQNLKIDGEVARTLTGTKRNKSEYVTIRGRFKVEETADAAGGKAFRCKVRRIANDEIIQAEMLDSLMSSVDQEAVIAALSKRTLIELEIHARKVGTSYRDAKIVSVSPISSIPQQQQNVAGVQPSTED